MFRTTQLAAPEYLLTKANNGPEYTDLCTSHESVGSNMRTGQASRAMHREHTAISKRTGLMER